MENECSRKRSPKKIVGIIGGMCPETSSKFYLDIIRRSRKHCNSYPAIITDSISVPFSLEKDLVQKSKNENRLLPLLKGSIKKLNKSGIDFIVIPCNTAHIFIDELKKESNVPIVSIIEETVKIVKERGFRNVGLLATKKTVDSKLYENILIENRINVILPTEEEQKNISRIIIRILRNKAYNEEKESLTRIIKNLIKKGSEAIILGCTDLQIILALDEFEVELLDSMKILAESTFQRIVNLEK